MVGRSPATVRSWESDKSTPNDPAVLSVLSAVIGIDERTLFEKAGVERPVYVETSPTIEEALASLAPIDKSEPMDGESDSAPLQLVSAKVPDLDAVDVEEVALEDIATVVPQVSVPEMTPLFDAGEDDDQWGLEEILEEYDAVDEISPVGSIAAVGAGAMDASPTGEMTVAPRSPVPVPTTAPISNRGRTTVLIPVEASYIEDPSQKRFYQARTIATIAGMAGLLIAFIWAAGQGLGAVAEWWNEFFENLNL